MNETPSYEAVQKVPNPIVILNGVKNLNCFRALRCFVPLNMTADNDFLDTLDVVAAWPTSSPVRACPERSEGRGSSQRDRDCVNTLNVFRIIVSKR